MLSPPLRNAKPPFAAAIEVRAAARCRATRLTNAFSKKAENHALMVSLHFMYYNFCRIHKTLRVTPAMQAGVTTRLWSIEDIVDLVEARAEPPKRPATYRKRQ